MTIRFQSLSRNHHRISRSSLSSSSSSSIILSRVHNIPNNMSMMNSRRTMSSLSKHLMRPTSTLLSLSSVVRIRSSSLPSINFSNTQHVSFRSYTIANTTTTTTTTSQGTKTAKTTNTEKNKDQTATSRTTNCALPVEKEEMEQLLDMAYKQAREISEIALLNLNNKRQQQKQSKQMKVPNHSSMIKPINTSSSSLPAVAVQVVANDPIKISTTQETEAQLQIQHEASAAEALLKLTSQPIFQSFIKNKQERNDDVVLSLHSAFLSVIQWLCHSLSSSSTSISTTTSARNLQTRKFIHKPIDIIVLPTKESILLSHILSLTERSHDLNLPLTIPLYESICYLIAKFQSSSSSPSLFILELTRAIVQPNTFQSSSSSLSSNQSPLFNLQSTFFSSTLKELLYQNKIADVIQLLHGMNTIHNIPNVDLNTGMELLAVLKHQVDLSLNYNEIIEDLYGVDDFNDDDSNSSVNGIDGNVDGNVSNKDDIVSSKISGEFNETDAMELAMILQQPIMEELNIKKRELEAYQRQYENRLRHNVENEEDVEDGENRIEFDGSRLEDDLDDDDFDYLVNDDDLDDDENDDDDSSISSTKTLVDLNYMDDLDDYDNFDDDDTNNNENENEYIISDHDIQQLNKLVQAMKDNENDLDTKAAAQSAAILILEKLNNHKQTNSAATAAANNEEDEYSGNDNNDDDHPTNLSSSSQEGNHDEHSKTHSSESRGSLSGLNARFHVNSSTGAIDKVEFTIDPNNKSPELTSNEKKRFDEMHHSLLEDMIYTRDPSWEIPDVVAQLEEWNGDHGLLFSKEYESEIIKEITSENDPFDFLDVDDDDDNDR